MRRTMAWMAAALAMCVALAGCTVGEPSGADGGRGQKVITFLTFETPNLTPEVWDAAIRRVTDAHPEIKVNKLVAPTVDRDAYARQLLASGQLPDVMIAVSPTGLAEAGHLYEWTPEELEDFSVPTAGSIGGKVYQLPANTQTIPNVYFNKELFAQAGITDPPRTWDELLEVCARLKAAGITPFVVGGGGQDTWASVLPYTGLVSTIVFRETPDWVRRRRAGEVRFTGSAFRTASERLAELAAAGYIDRRGLSRDYAQTEQAFLDGKGAMYPMGSWFAASADKKRKDFGVFPWPTEDGELVLPAYTGGGLSVSAKAQHLDAAKEFALAFQLDKTNLDNSVFNDAVFPAVKGYQPPADAGPVFRATYQLYQQAVAQDAVVNAFAWESGDDSLIPGMPDKVHAAAQDLMIGNKPVQEVIAALDRDWELAS